MAGEGRVHVCDVPGVTDYRRSLDFQRRCVEGRKSGEIRDLLIVTQHEPVITLGRYGDPGGVVAGEGELGAAGIEVVRVERGGQATYHGPGQLVAYPILSLKELGLGVKAYVSLLEEVMLATCRESGLDAQLAGGRPGVYCAAGKLGALGVAVTGGVTFHGVALNVNVDLAAYSLIIPCGLEDTPMTSLADALGADVAFGETKELFLRMFAKTFQVELTQATAGDLPEACFFERMIDC